MQTVRDGEQCRAFLRKQGAYRRERTPDLVLLELNRETRVISAPEFARRLNLPRSTVFRLLSTLENMGFVERTGVRTLRARPRSGAAAQRRLAT